MKNFLQITCYVIFVKLLNADFVYKDFNETTGLAFVGNAGTTNCRFLALNNYGDVQGKADRFNEDAPLERSEQTDLTRESSVETNKEEFNAAINEYMAGFLHRPDTISAPNDCFIRGRLTPSGPSKVGALWHIERVPVNNGFETSFTFQISDHSKECTVHKDQYFSQFHHRTCSVRGADGFAFVIHSDPKNITALGEKGIQMGFGGISNSLAVAFDTWPNPGDDVVSVDQVRFQSRGVYPNNALPIGLLGLPRATSLADGKIHLAKIAYYGDLQTQYLDKLVASDSLKPYLLDNGEQKRVGTLVVFVDDGIKNDIPLMAMPINLSLLLKLDDDKAWVGFTSSTGRFYAKHDILSWHWCDQVRERVHVCLYIMGDTLINRTTSSS